MSSVVIAGDTSGSVTLQAPATAGSVVVTLPAVSGTLSVTGSSPSFTNLTTTGVITAGGGLISNGSLYVTSAAAPTGASGPALFGGYSVGGTAAFIQGYNSTTSAFTDMIVAGSTVRFNSGASSTEAMRIDSTGNVAIGMSTTTGAKFRTLLSGTAVSGNTTGLAIGADNIFMLSSNNWATTNSTVFLTGGGTSTTAGQISSAIGFSRQNDADWGTQLRFYVHPADTVALTTLNEAMRIDASGNIQMGAASAAPNTVGTFRINLTTNSGTTKWGVGPYSNDGTAFYVTNTSGTGVYLPNGNTSWVANSDERLKDVIEPITDAVNKVSTLRAVIGKYKTDEEGVRRSFLMAQDVQAVLPEAVHVNTDNEKTLGLSYTEVVPLLVAAIKELKAEVDALKAGAK